MTTRTPKDFWVEMSIREISTQAHFAGIAFSHLDPKAAANNDAVFSSIHSFLSHCAMVSKMLAAKDDGKPPKSIGDVLGVSCTSLIHQRVFRNHLEHYDERLKAWIKKYALKSMIGTYNIGPKSAMQIPDLVFVSHYDPASGIFTFVNDNFDLTMMFAEVQRIQAMADDWVHCIETGQTSPPFIHRRNIMPARQPRHSAEETARRHDEIT